MMNPQKIPKHLIVVSENDLWTNTGGVIEVLRQQELSTLANLSNNWISTQCLIIKQLSNNWLNFKGVYNLSLLLLQPIPSNSSSLFIT